MLKQSLLALPLVLCGCTGGIIQSVALAPGQTPDIFQPVDIVVSGSGTCGILNVNWGDSAADRWETFSNVDLTAQQHLTHTYTDWRGGKTVWVKPQYHCAGTAQTRFTTTPTKFDFGWARRPNGMNPTPCFFVPTVTGDTGSFRPSVAPNSIVHITGEPSPRVNFGCSFDGCIYDPDGRLGTSASSAFSFPGFREYSLVVRVAGTTLFQGGKSAAPFELMNGGGLEFCQNTDNPTGNITGGWQVSVRVDELGFPPQ